MLGERRVLRCSGACHRLSPWCQEGDVVCPAWLCGVGEPRRSSRCRGFSSPFELVVGEEEQRVFLLSSSRGSRVARPQILLPAPGIAPTGLGPSLAPPCAGQAALIRGPGLVSSSRALGGGFSSPGRVPRPRGSFGDVESKVLGSLCASHAAVTPRSSRCRPRFGG